jgi:transporter family protein
VAILVPVLGIFWFPGRNKTTPLQWLRAVPAIGITSVVADFLYFHALSMEGSMISMISALRRSSVLITFILGAFLFKEQNLKRKGFCLVGILAGILLITSGSR